MTREEAAEILLYSEGVFSKEEYEALNMAIKALDPEPCEDCISRKEVLDIVNNPLNIRLDEIIKKLPSVTPKPKMSENPTGSNCSEKPNKWIPVSEGLPENRNQEVLISLEWGIDIGRYSDGEWHSEWINHYDDGNVLAWMPLPEPYRAESEGVK